MTDFDNWIVKTVEQVGWAVLSVGPRKDSDDPREWFSYTVGLTKTFGWPEMICFGLETETRKHMINDAVDECQSKGARPAPGLRLSKVLNGFDVLLVDGNYIPESYFGLAEWFARHWGATPVARLQLLWPDASGRFPNDDDCDEDIVTEQTPLEVE